MSIHSNRPAERCVSGFQLSIARFRHRCAPGTFGTGVYQSHRTMNLNARKAAQPSDSLFSQRFTSRRRHLVNRAEKRLDLRQLFGKFLQ